MNIQNEAKLYDNNTYNENIKCTNNNNHLKGAKAIIENNSKKNNSTTYNKNGIEIMKKERKDFEIIKDNEINKKNINNDNGYQYISNQIIDSQIKLCLCIRKIKSIIIWKKKEQKCKIINKLKQMNSKIRINNIAENIISIIIFTAIIIIKSIIINIIYK